MKRVLRWIRWLLLASAASLLVYCGFVVTGMWTFQRAEDLQFRRLLMASAQNASAVSIARFSPAAAEGLIGRVEVPRLGISVIVMEGTSGSVLRRAVGHISGTALPGQRGNVGISGHRDTFFRPLRNIKPSDIILLRTTAGEYRYRVLSTEVVTPDDVAVLEPGSGDTLTLVTCYPFYFVGPAPKRFIVRAGKVIY